MFNLRHSSLRVSVERIIGYYKRKFSLVGDKRAPPFPFKTQVQIVLGLAGVWNYLCYHGQEEEPLTEVEEDAIATAQETPIQDQHPPVPGSAQAATKRQVMEALRDRIAQEMWDDWKGNLVSAIP